jgi:hypothetical protein
MVAWSKQLDAAIQRALWDLGRSNWAWDATSKRYESRTPEERERWWTHVASANTTSWRELRVKVVTMSLTK